MHAQPASREPPMATKSVVSEAGLRWLVAAWVLLLIVRNAWVSDDAFITLRSVDNFVHGRGITWNPGQRVQAFSHPLWFAVLSLARVVVDHAYYGTLYASLLFATATLVGLVRGIPARHGLALVILLALGCSKSFVDFSTSGLENPLSHFLLLGWLYALLRREAAPQPDSRALDGLTGLLLLCRMDLAVVLAPGYLWATRRRWRDEGPRAALRGLAWAASPQLVWLVFSLVYFGLALPNTAYAKLNVELPLHERLSQAGFYMLSLVVDDPVSAVLIVAGVVLGLRSPSRALRAAAAGAGLQLVYLCWIGGDFMLGRFFSTPLLLAVVILLRTPVQARHQLAGFALLGVCSLATAAPPWLTGRPPGDGPHADAPIARFRDVTDERRFYFKDTGLIHAVRGEGMPRGAWVKEGRALASTRGTSVYAAGIRGYAAGPEAWLIDLFALTDPFLAQHRVVPLKHWKSGHYPRELPADYRRSVETETNLLSEPRERTLYDDIVLATQAPLWSAERWAAIVRLNTGADAVAVMDFRRPK